MEIQRPLDQKPHWMGPVNRADGPKPLLAFRQLSSRRFPMTTNQSVDSFAKHSPSVRHILRPYGVRSTQSRCFITSKWSTIFPLLRPPLLLSLNNANLFYIAHEVDIFGLMWFYRSADLAGSTSFLRGAPDCPSHPPRRCHSQY